MDKLSNQSYVADASGMLERSSALQEVPTDLLREVAGALLEAEN